MWTLKNSIGMTVMLEIEIISRNAREQFVPVEQNEALVFQWNLDEVDQDLRVQL